jgi:hypothetical protein
MAEVWRRFARLFWRAGSVGYKKQCAKVLHRFLGRRQQGQSQKKNQECFLPTSAVSCALCTHYSTSWNSVDSSDRFDCSGKE